jgi:hypothetical protein
MGLMNIREQVAMHLSSHQCLFEIQCAPYLQKYFVPKYCWVHSNTPPTPYTHVSGITWARLYKVVQIWPGQTVTCLHTNSPGHIWTTLYIRTLIMSIGTVSEMSVHLKHRKDLSARKYFIKFSPSKISRLHHIISSTIQKGLKEFLITSVCTQPSCVVQTKFT